MKVNHNNILNSYYAEKHPTSFKGSDDIPVNEESTDETLKAASDAARAVALAQINIEKNSKSAKDTYKEDMQKAAEMAKQGMNAEQIGKILGRSADSILYGLKKACVETEKQKIRKETTSPEFAAEVLRLYEVEGLSISQISRKMGRARKPITRIIENAGYESAKVTSIKAKHDPETVEAVRKMSQDGYSIAKMAKELNKSVDFIKRVIKENKIKTKRQLEKERASSPEYRNKVVEMGKNGFNSYQISDALGGDPTTIRGILRENGVEIIIKNTDRIHDPKYIKQVVDLHKEGLTFGQIAEKLSERVEIVSTILKNAGEKTQIEEYKELVSNPEYRSKVIELGKQGYTSYAISEELGGYIKDIKEILKENQIKAKSNTSRRSPQDAAYRAQVIELGQKGYSGARIQEELGGDEKNIMIILNSAGILTKKQQDNARTADPKYQKAVIEMYNQNFGTPAISKKLGGSTYVVLKTLNDAGIKTPAQEEHERLSNPDNIRKIIEMGIEGKQPPEIAKVIGCSAPSVVIILNEANIATKKQQDNARAIDTEYIKKVIEMGKQGIMPEQIAKELGGGSALVVRILNRAEIKTQRQIVNENSSKPEYVEKVIELAKQGLSPKNIAKELGGTSNTAFRILRRRGILTKKQQFLEITDYAYKKQIEEKLNASEDANTIIKDLGITKYRYVKICKKYNLDKFKDITLKIPNKDYCEFNIDELKDKIVELAMNETVCKSTSLSNCLNYLYDNEIFLIAQKDIAIDLIKNIDDVIEQKTTLDNVINSDTAEIIFDKLDEEEQEEQEKQDLLEDYQDRLISFSETSKALYNICIKYIPQSTDDDESFDNIRFITDILTKHSSDEEKALKKLTYWDLKNNPNELLKKAQEYAKDSKGAINVEKAGEYILSAQKFEEALNDISDENHNKYAQIVKSRLIDNDKKNYSDAYKILKIYDITPNALKQTLLNEAVYQNNYNDYIFINKLTELEEKIKFCDLDNATQFEFLHVPSGKNKKGMILPEAKYQCLQYCQEHYNQNSFDRFYKFMDFFYHASTTWAPRKFGASGIKDIDDKTSVTSEIKIKGGSELGDWRLFATTNSQDEKQNSYPIPDNVDSRYIFNTFNNHEWLLQQP